MTAKDKYNILISAIDQGKTVYVGTHLRCWKVTPATFKRWEKAGLNLWSIKGKSLYMRFGKRNDCIDYCALKVVK
jgi:hypothetical protein